MLLDITPEELRILERAIGGLIVETLKTVRDTPPTSQRTEVEQELTRYIELQTKMTQRHMPSDR